jgi:hypothetical protein
MVPVESKVAASRCPDGTSEVHGADAGWQAAAMNAVAVNSATRVATVRVLRTVITSDPPVGLSRPGQQGHPTVRYVAERSVLM